MRYIGIEHRRKRTATDEARPTHVYILAEDKSVVEYKLDDDMAEINFVYGLFPVEFRPVEESDDISACKPGHIRWRKLKEGESLEEIPISQRRKNGKVWEVADQIACQFDGLQPGDLVGILLGSAGDRLAYALSRRGETIGASVYRMPLFFLKKRQYALAKKKGSDACILAELVSQERQLFYITHHRDRDLIMVAEAYYRRMDAMLARIVCEQKIYCALIESLFCSEESAYPEDSIEVGFKKAKAKDPSLKKYRAQERKQNKELAKLLERLVIYTEIFKPIQGLGPAIAARLLVAIRDIRRFHSKEKLKAYLGVHVMRGGRFGDRTPDKQFVRRSEGTVASWDAEGRKALWLLAEQFNRRPKSEWGQRLLRIKAQLRATHPDIICKECACKWGECQSPKSHTRLYTDMHIHKMTFWRTITKFVEWLWGAWMRIERRYQAEQILA